MFLGDDPSIITQENSRDQFESLLSREQCLMKPVPSNSEQYEQHKNRALVNDIEQSSGSEHQVSVLPSNTSNSENSQDSLEQQKDFNYSQKLFHIADGNLYSIFSPIQGRSYGMKPSFLRKQKYTVQECHNRGRKNPRKGLKFHNFLPSESVTSEKDSGYTNAKWKVYSECRLREEHGTKQISISNWSQSVQKPNNGTPTFSENLSMAEDGISTSDNKVPSISFSSESVALVPNNNQKELKTNATPPNGASNKFNLQQYKEETNNFQSDQNSNCELVQKILSSHSSKKDSLNILLNSLSQKTVEKNNNSDESETQSRNSQKHRRKPVQTRRIVPYNKYLTIMEENDTLPLDLSSKCFMENSSLTTTSIDEEQNSPDCHLSLGRSTLTSGEENSKGVSNFFPRNERFLMSSDELVQKESTVLKDISPLLKTSPVAILYPFPISKNLPPGKHNILYPPPPPLIGFNSSEIDDFNLRNAQPAAESSFSRDASHFLPRSQFSVQKSVVKEIQSKPRRRNQRSVMKQKLEDSFRQNGFLVKTKQVSDGEATFCKFRQLRKCTRYYLKSLEQHLPDEFHKMLKGFLPPKTVLPPVLGASNPINET